MTTPTDSYARRVPKAPSTLVLEVARRTGRSPGTITAVIHGRVKSAPIQRAVEDVRRELNIPEPAPAGESTPDPPASQQVEA